MAASCATTHLPPVLKGTANIRGYAIGDDDLRPSIFFLGYIFAVDNMPQVSQMLSKFIPATVW